MGPTPLWPKAGSTGDRLHFTRWRDDQVQIHSCPDANLVAVGGADGWVDVTLEVKDFGTYSLTNASRWWHPDLSDPALFEVDGLEPVQLVNEGAVVRLEVPGLPEDSPLDVTLIAGVDDILGRRVQDD
jgi:hypothetical protein